VAQGHIFISYARKDGAPAALRLEDFLSREGFTTWRDKRDIDPAQDFTAEIEKAIEAASFVVTCITPDVKRENSFVQREIGYALAINKPVAVVRFHAVVPPISVVTHTYFDLFPQWEPGFASLAALLKCPERYQAPYAATQDPFRGYLEALYRQIVRYLDTAVTFSLTGRADTPILPIKAVARGGAVAGPRPEILLSDFFDQIGVTDEEPAVVYESLQAAFDKYSGRLLLLGEPGSGKTVSLMALARDAVARRLENREAPLPVLARVPTWDPEEKQSMSAWIAGLAPTFGTAVSTLVIDGKALLLLDGLDELTGERKKADEADPKQEFIRILPQNNQIVLTCRTKEYAGIRDKAALNGSIELRPLEDVQIRAYLTAVPDLWDLLTAREDLRNVLRVPLLLNLFAAAFTGLRSELTDFSYLERGQIRDAILERFIRRRYEYEQRKLRNELSLTLDEFYRHMGSLLFSVEPWLSGGGWWQQPEYTMEELSQSDEARTTVETAVRLNLFRGDEKGVFRFAHLLFRDHFAFRYVVPFLNATRPRIRASALLVLRDLRDRRAIPMFLSALSDKSGAARWQAIAGLKKLADPSTVQPLIGCLGDRAQPTVGDAYDQTPPGYWLAAEALTTIGKPAVEALIAALNRTDSQIRGQAAEVLGRIGDARAIEPLKAALATTDPRQMAVTEWWERPVIDIMKAALKKCEMGTGKDPTSPVA